MLTVERIEGASRFAALAAEWDALLDDSASASVFLTHDWLHAWWTHLGGARQVYLLAVRRGADLVAVAPLALAPPRLSRLVPFRSLEFLGQGTAGSDYLDVVARRGEEAAVVDALAAHLSRARFMLQLGRVDRRSSLALALSRRLAETGWAVREARREVCPFVRLPATWDAYLQQLGSAHRANVQRRLRNLHRHHAVELHRVRTEEERGGALARLIALHEERWRPRGGSEAFRASRLVAFHHDFTRRALARGRLRLLELRLDGRPAAALYGLRYGDTFSFYQSGFDPAYAKDSVGLVMMALAIRSAIEEGAAQYDFLHGDEGYKALWARDTRELADLDVFPPLLHGAACRQAVTLGRAARRFARRLLPEALAARLLAGLGAEA
jgi:CelD/BcsL family acetyltransferase involved in cellulose biosynthesis